MSKIVLRPFNPETDSGLIYDAYPKGVWYGAFRPIKMNKSSWFKQFFEKMKEQLETAHIYMACIDGDHDAMQGFSIVENGQLEFVYVKPHVRQQGIGTLLTINKYKTINKQNITKVAQSILEKHPELIGEEHGKRINEETEL